MVPRQVTIPDHPLAPLRYPDYRRVWAGLLISMTGSNLRNAAVLWHVTLLVDASQRALALATVGLVRVVPIVVCSLFAGVLADAVDRRRLLLLINGGLLLLTSAWAVCTWFGWVSIGSLYVFTAAIAGASTFDNPARNSFFPMLIPREQLSRAIVLNSVAFQFAAVLGPAVGGTLIGRYGIAVAYLCDAVSFLVIVVQLMRVRVSGHAGAAAPKVSFAAVGDGLRYVFGNPLIRASMLLDFFATFFASATALLPIFAQDVLHVGAAGYGMLSSAMAAGSMVTSILLIAVIERINRRGMLLVFAVLCYGAANLAFAYSTWFWVSWLCLFFAGASDMVSTLIRQIIRQLETPDALRGRIASVNLLFFMGGPQLGELEAGVVAHAWGLRFSVASGGLACIGVALWTLLRVPVLRDYGRSRPTQPV
jgi:MFS family permease